jgi:drug/metabolite transporter (DMT)-like permease
MTNNPISEQPLQQEPNLVLGAGLMTLAFFANTLQSAIAKAIPVEISGAQYGFHIFSIALLMLLSIVLWRRRNDFKTEILPWHLLRAVAGSSSFLLFMTAVKSIDLVNATVLLSTMPILIPLIAWVVLHQRIPRGLWFAIAIGFAGLLVVVRPSTTTIGQPGDLLALSAALTGAIEFLVVRRLNQSESSLTQILYYLIVGSLVAAPLAIPKWHSPSPQSWLLLVGAAIFLLCFHFAIIKAFTYAQPHQISVFQYTAVVFSAIIGWLFFKEQPDLLVAVGIVLICVGGVLAIYLGRKQEPDNPVQVR